MPKCFSIRGYCHLYRSMLRFLPVEPFEAAALVFKLNTANIDTCLAGNPGRAYRELSESDFVARLRESAAKPYFTEVQLYKSLEAVLDNIRWEDITESQRDAVCRTVSLMRTLESRFEMTHGCEIDGPETVYSRCRFDLMPGDDAPTACMADDNNLIILYRPVQVSSKHNRKHSSDRSA